MKVYLAVWTLCLVAVVMTCEPHYCTRLSQSNSQTQAQREATSPHKADQDCQPCPNTAKADKGSPKWYTSPEWWLVVLGFPTLGFLVYQAIVSGIAAEASKKSADAAFLNAQALINSERPWLTVEIKEIRGENAAKTHFQLYGYNHGNSPAHVTSCKGPIVTWLDDPDSELPPSPDYGTWEWDTLFLVPRHRFPLRDEIEPWSKRLKFVTPRATQGIPTPGKPQLVIYGLLEYRDGVTDIVHRTAFCFRRKRDKLSDMGGHLVPCGPKGYNEYT